MGKLRLHSEEIKVGRNFYTHSIYKYTWHFILFALSDVRLCGPLQCTVEESWFWLDPRSTPLLSSLWFPVSPVLASQTSMRLSGMLKQPSQKQQNLPRMSIISTAGVCVSAPVEGCTVTAGARASPSYWELITTMRVTGRTDSRARKPPGHNNTANLDFQLILTNNQ